MPKITIHANFTQHRFLLTGGMRACSCCAMTALQFFLKNPMGIAELTWAEIEGMDCAPLTAALNTCINKGVTLNNRYAYTKADEDVAATSILSKAGRFYQQLAGIFSQKYPDHIYQYIIDHESDSPLVQGEIITIALRECEHLDGYAAVSLETALTTPCFKVDDELLPLPHIMGYIAVGDNHCTCIMRLNDKYMLFNSSSESFVMGSAYLTIYDGRDELRRDLARLWSRQAVAQFYPYTHQSYLLDVQLAGEKAMIQREALRQEFHLIMTQFSEEQYHNLCTHLARGESVDKYFQWQIAYAKARLESESDQLSEQVMQDIVQGYHEEMASSDALQKMRVL